MKLYNNKYNRQNGYKDIVDEVMDTVSSTVSNAVDVTLKPKPSTIAKAKFTSLRQSVSGYVMAILGGIMAFGSFVTAGVFSSLPYTVGSPSLYITIGTISFIVGVFGITRVRKQHKNIDGIMSLINRDGNTPIKLIMDRNKRSEVKVLADIQRIVNTGIIGEAYIDRKANLIVTCVNGIPKEEVFIANEIKCPVCGAPANALEEYCTRCGSPLKINGQTVVNDIPVSEQAEIQRLENIISETSDWDIREKIIIIEDTLKKIYEAAEKDKGALAQIEKYNSLYFPYLYKIVDGYNDTVRLTGEQGELKFEINSVLVVMGKSLDNILTKISDSKVMDISSDIYALKSMLNLKG